MDHIYLAQCKTYDLTAVRSAVHDCLSAFGGAQAILAAGKRGKDSKTVLLKANLVKAAGIEEAATTHPAVVQAVAEEFIGAGAHVFIGDCPAIPQSESAMTALFRQTGLSEAAKNAGAELIFDFSHRTIPAKSGCKTKEFPFWSQVHEADLIVNCAKLKTHAFATMTGASKNLFGLMPGLLKSAKHAEHMSIEDFAEMIVDLCETAREIVPVFSLIDGIVGMEGKGPTGGTPKVCGAVIASDSPYAADFAGSMIMGIKPKDVPILAAASRRGAAPVQAADFVWDGVSVETLITPFRLAKHHGVFQMLVSAILPEKLKKQLQKNKNPYPVINEAKCVACGKCVEICPVHAASKDGGIHISHEKCIRCYCCHEVCPKRAIDI